MDWDLLFDKDVLVKLVLLLFYWRNIIKANHLQNLFNSTLSLWEKKDVGHLFIPYIFFHKLTVFSKQTWQFDISSWSICWMMITCSSVGERECAGGVCALERCSWRFFNSLCQHCCLKKRIGWYFSQTAVILQRQYEFWHKKYCF